eukprot:gene32332-39101_t
MPKLKIGETQVAGEASSAERKVYNNGHKCFTAMEAKSLEETQSREKRTLQNFEKSKSSYIRPRNPLTGDLTPRKEYNLRGDVTREIGIPLFPPNRPEGPPAEQTTKLKALNPSKYRVGGYDESLYRGEGIPPVQRGSLATERISSLQNMQDHMSGEIQYLMHKQAELEKVLKEMPKTKWV